MNKIKKASFLLIILMILFSSCYDQYKGTRNICGNNLYVEFYNIVPQDMWVCYLTDSINFRVKIARFDPGFQNYEFKCNVDSICVQEVQRRNEFMNDTVEIIKTFTCFNLKDLKKRHNLKNE